MAKSWSCVFCESTVSELGQFVKINNARYAHLSCFKDDATATGIELGRSQILDEQHKAEQAKRDQIEQEAKSVFDALTRCPKCGVRVSTDGVDRFAKWGEVRSQTESGRCVQCVREEVQLRAGARQSAAPASAAEAVRTAATRPVEATEKEQPKRDRFSLIDMD